MAARYWCHMCSQIVNPIMEVEQEMKCPLCQNGFIEDMGGGSSTMDNHDSDSDLGSDRALSLWAPILLGMMNNPRRRRRFRRHDFDEDDDNDNDDSESRHSGDTELDRELESIILRRRRSSATILQLLQGIRAGMATESENSESDRDRDRDRERERVVLINPFNQTIIVHGSYDPNQDQNQNQSPIGSLGDYFVGPGLDLLLQHLAENDPNRYGTPPAQKEAVEAMPSVKIDKNLQCSVCLDDFEIGAEAKEMPCKHKFHNGCIIPWLELHSSCPICRYQIPSDESKHDSDGSRSSSNRRETNNGNGNGSGEQEDGEERSGSGSGRRFSFPWPFNGFFTSSGSQTGSGNSSSNSSSSSSNARGSASHTDEN